MRLKARPCFAPSPSHTTRLFTVAHGILSRLPCASKALLDFSLTALTRRESQHPLPFNTVLPPHLRGSPHFFCDPPPSPLPCYSAIRSRARAPLLSYIARLTPLVSDVLHAAVIRLLYARASCGRPHDGHAPETPRWSSQKSSMAAEPLLGMPRVRPLLPRTYGASRQRTLYWCVALLCERSHDTAPGSY